MQLSPLSQPQNAILLHAIRLLRETVQLEVKASLLGNSALKLACDCTVQAFGICSAATQHGIASSHGLSVLHPQLLFSFRV